jgi:hypothetical protein
MKTRYRPLKFEIQTPNTKSRVPFALFLEARWLVPEMVKMVSARFGNYSKRQSSCYLHGMFQKKK